MGLNKNLLWGLFFLSLTTSRLFGQVNKASTDSILVKIAERLTAIENKIKLSDVKDVDLKKEKKDLKKENDFLLKYLKKGNDSLLKELNNSKIKDTADKNLAKLNSKIQTKEIDSLSKVILYNNNENNDFKKKYNDLIATEKLVLENEINAILNQNYTFPNALLSNIQERWLDAKLPPSNSKVFSAFYNSYKIINNAYKVLESAYEANAVEKSISEVEKITLDPNNLGLIENKKDVISLLKNYCNRGNEISKYIDDAKVKKDENSRQSWLDAFYYQTKGYPFLKLQLKNAQKDNTYKLEKVNCK